MDIAGKKEFREFHEKRLAAVETAAARICALLGGIHGAPECEAPDPREVSENGFVADLGDLDISGPLPGSRDTLEKLGDDLARVAVEFDEAVKGFGDRSAGEKLLELFGFTRMASRMKCRRTINNGLPEIMKRMNGASEKIFARLNGMIADLYATHEKLKATRAEAEKKVTLLEEEMEAPCGGDAEKDIAAARAAVLASEILDITTQLRLTIAHYRVCISALLSLKARCRATMARYKALFTRAQILIAARLDECVAIDHAGAAERVVLADLALGMERTMQ